MSELRTMTLNGRRYDCFVDNVARSQLAATVVVNSASGDNIVLSDASNFDVVGLKVFGKTTQDGTPAPDNPVELVSTGVSGAITVNIAGESADNSITISTPNGLPGIPVSSGGNYTDANGQQWICDEIDLARGVYVRRIQGIVFDASNLGNIRPWGEDGGFVTSEIGIANITNCVMCDKLHSHDAILVFKGEQGVNVNNGYDQLVFAISGVTTMEEIKVWLQSNSLTFLFALATPVETPLSTEELNAYAALHTYRDYSKVSNDAGAYMELEYVMDAKKYIDSLVISGGASARLSSITLSSSAWKTDAENLHSQVVSISGITEYSKVDLLPSVEQLAIFHNKDVAFVTENEDGVVTVYAIGDKPTTDYTMQVSITEVIA